jgi:hypothetical protein
MERRLRNEKALKRKRIKRGANRRRKTSRITEKRTVGTWMMGTEGG